MAFTLRTLGSLELRDAHGNMVRGAGSQRKPLLILAVTAMQRDGITRNRLLRMLWPGVEADRARASLKQHLYALRMATGSATIIGGAPTLRVDRTVVKVDVLELYDAIAAGDLRAAADHYRGDLLDGIDVAGCPDLAAMIEEWRDEMAPAAELLRGAVAVRHRYPGQSGESMAATRADRLLYEQVDLGVRALRTLPRDPVAASHRAGAVLEGLVESLHHADRAPLDPGRVEDLLSPLLPILRQSELYRELESAGRSGGVGPALWQELVAGSIDTIDPVGRAIDQALQRSPVAGQFREVTAWLQAIFVRTLLTCPDPKIAFLGAAPVAGFTRALELFPEARPRVTIADPDPELLLDAEMHLNGMPCEVEVHLADQASAVVQEWARGSDLVVFGPTTGRQLLSDLVWLVDAILPTDGAPIRLALMPAVSGAGWVTALRYLMGWCGVGLRGEDLALLANTPHGNADVDRSRTGCGHRWMVSAGQ